MTAQEAADVLEACFNLHRPRRPLRKDCLEALAVLRDAAQNAEAERDEALRHVAGPLPSIERMVEAHSRLPAKWFENHPKTADHFAYYQGPEACYVCTLIVMVQAAEARVVRLEAALRRAWDETDYCYVCECHPSHGHGSDCILAEVSEPPEQAA